MEETGIFIGDGIRYTALCDPKFRSSLLSVQFYVHRNRESAPVHALLPDLLTASSAEYPSLSAMTLRLQSLYAAEFLAKLSLCGDDAALDFTASWLEDAYALEGEAVTEDVLSLMIGALLHPNAANGAFCEPEFRICKQNLLDDIGCEQNDKRSYVLRRAAELAYCGEPAAIPAHGTRAEAEAVTPQLALRTWQEILRTAFIEIIAVTPTPKPSIAARLAAAFAPIRRQPLSFSLTAPSPIKPAPARREERMAVGQTKLVLAYKYVNIPPDVLYLLCCILGWNSDALLFVNLRERQSLCYYCCLQCAADKHTLMIDSGIDADNLAAVQDAVAAQITALQTGVFSEEMLENGVLRYACQAAAASDSAYDMAAEQLRRYRRADTRTPQQVIAAMRQITRAQIAEAAAQLRQDAVFILRADREEAEADAD